jgi:hypothetical protein
MINLSVGRMRNLNSPFSGVGNWSLDSVDVSVWSSQLKREISNARKIESVSQLNVRHDKLFVFVFLNAGFSQDRGDENLMMMFESSEDFAVISRRFGVVEKLGPDGNPKGFAFLSFFSRLIIVCKVLGMAFYPSHCPVTLRCFACQSQLRFPRDSIRKITFKRLPSKQNNRKFG